MSSRWLKVKSFKDIVELIDKGTTMYIPHSIRELADKQLNERKGLK